MNRTELVFGETMLAEKTPKKCPACNSTKVAGVLLNGALKLRCRRCGFESVRKTV